MKIQVIIKSQKLVLDIGPDGVSHPDSYKNKNVQWLKKEIMSKQASDNGNTGTTKLFFNGKQLKDDQKLGSLTGLKENSKFMIVHSQVPATPASYASSSSTIQKEISTTLREALAENPSEKNENVDNPQVLDVGNASDPFIDIRYGGVDMNIHVPWPNSDLTTSNSPILEPTPTFFTIKEILASQICKKDHKSPTLCSALCQEFQNHVTNPAMFRLIYKGKEYPDSTQLSQVMKTGLPPPISPTSRRPVMKMLLLPTNTAHKTRAFSKEMADIAEELKEMEAMIGRVGKQISHRVLDYVDSNMALQKFLSDLEEIEQQLYYLLDRFQAEKTELQRLSVLHKKLVTETERLLDSLVQLQ